MVIVLLIVILLTILLAVFSAMKISFEKKYINDVAGVIEAIKDKKDDYDISDELKEDFEDLMSELRNQERALDESVEEINSYKKELNITYKSLLAKSTELEYSNVVLEKRVANLSNLNAVGKSVLSELDLDKIISIILDAYFVLTGAKKISLYLWENGLLVNKAYKGNIKTTKNYQLEDYENQPKSELKEIYNQIAHDLTEEDEALNYSVLNVKGKELGVIYIIRESFSSNKNDDKETVSALAMHVAIAINNAIMYSELAVKERLNREVLIASNIQKNLLPKEVKIPFLLETAEYFEPAKEIGGDYYDYNITSDNQIFITIGDVSGKGVPASLVMTTIRAVLKTLSYTQDGPAEMLTSLNNFMCRDMSDEMFVTIFHSYYDNETKTLTYSNAGHNPLIVYKSKADEIIEKNVKGAAIGFIEDYKYREEKIELESKDILVYYTDGITECENAEKEMFGLEKLKKIIYENCKESSERIKEKILMELKEFRNSHDQLDDITLLVVKI